ncbi:MAG: hypothetical protein A3D92_04740 [Bacteroidetes bacterium RIFCSPHIGHO2_02_FULL_44_7]|nr:MAG: hypothetical protein A3D92_04740 [Bacteroidetes bacterium RIFCSPHIGHO2_02_FULL_44_7]
MNDEIIGLNGLRVDQASLNAYIESVRKGEVMNLLYARDEQLFSTELIVTEWEQPKFKFTNQVTDKNRKLYNYWLRHE